MIERFWMVMKVGEHSTPPNVRHDSKAKAETEAVRLAKLYGKEFVVLETVTLVRPIAPMPPVQVIRLDKPCEGAVHV